MTTRPETDAHTGAAASYQPSADPRAGAATGTSLDTTNTSLDSADASRAGGSASAPPASLGDAVRGHKWGLIASAVTSVVGAACSLAPYVAVYAVTVALFVDDAPQRIPTIVLWTAVALVVRATAGGLSTHVGHVAAYRILEDLRLAIVRKLQVIPLGRVQARSSGEMKKILHDDVEQLEEALAHGIPDGSAAAAIPLATTAVLFAVEWRLGLVALVALVLLVLISATGMKFANGNSAAVAEHSVVLNRAVMGYLGGIEVIRGYLREDSAYDRAGQAVVDGARLQNRANTGPLRWLVAVMNVATALAVVLLVPAAGLGHISGWADMGTVVLMLVLSLGYLTPIVGLVGTLATIVVRIRMSASSITELLAEEPLADPTNPTNPDHPRVPETYDVEFAGVEFGYRDDQTVLDGVSITVPAGTTTAFVGATGSGKSTLARLLARFQDVRAGSVSIGGVDVREIPAARLARMVGFIQQDEYVFAETLRENIRIARPEATDAQVATAARSAQLDDVAAGLPQGWDTRLSAGGGELSGGQRQRIAIARAFLKESPVIVLDEATAALDGVTEQRTLEAMEALMAGRTVIAIAHRLHTITGSDQIVFLEDGTVTARGDHAQLLAEHPPYADLWEVYTRAAGWRLESGQSLEGGQSGAEAVAALDGSRSAVPTDQGERQQPVSASDIVVPGLGKMGFFRQWRTMYGRGWSPLLRRGLVRMILESLLRGAPLLAVLLVVAVGIGALDWGDPGGGSLLTPGFIWTVTGALAAAMVLRVLVSQWANVLVWTLSANSKADLQLSILDRLRRVPLGFFQRTDAGRLGGLVTTDAPMIDFQNIPQQVIGSLVQPVYAIIILMIVDWRLALAALCGLPLFWALTVWADRVYHRAFSDMHTARQSATAAMLEQARGAAVLRGNPDSAVAGKYRGAMRDLARASIDMSVKAAPATALGQAAVECGQVVLIGVGAALFAAGAVSPVTLLIFLFLSLTLYQPIQELGALAGYRRNQQQIAGKVAEVWDADVLSEPEVSAEPVDPHAACAVEFSDVDFSYKTYDGEAAPGGEHDLALNGVSFRAEPGQITALVGASGAGKSTVANLVSRLWDVDAGAVLLGGVDVRELGSAGVLTRVTTVAQSVYLFDDTVRFNLTLGRPEATDEEVWAALRAAQADDVVAALPDGLDTMVAEGGADLSGGQRQRLAITRALLKDSPVLVLDEAVASVDPGTEDRIQAALSRLAAGRTVIVIAHRIATITGAGRIVVVDDGRVAGVGTHEELLADCAQYRELARVQGIDRRDGA